MKKFVFLLFVLSGCNLPGSNDFKATDDMTAKEIIEKNAYIDEEAYPDSRSTNVGFWTSTRRAAYYRMFKAMVFDEDGIEIKCRKVELN